MRHNLLARQFQYRWPLPNNRRSDEDTSQAVWALSDGRSERRGDEMRWKGPDGRLHVPAPTAEITKMTTDLVISSRGSPWRIYSRMMVTVFSAFFLLYSCLLIVIGLVDWNPTIIIVASLISIPPILLALRITRPPIIQLWNATPDATRNTLHNRAMRKAVNNVVA